ncbi:MAG: N4-gp56 family major capsid protein [Nitrospirae bacterium RBG_13_41_22]|nr:MAG: N4-gp56 family major capsid protein [Nitrospirae bacterium RBG_13_41_22]
MPIPENANTYDSLSPRTRGKAVKKLLERGQHMMVTERFGMIDPQPKNSTDTRKYRRYHSLPRASAPLADGISVKGRKLSFTDVSMTLQYYGDAVIETRKVKDTHEDPVLNEITKILGEQAGETIEELRINYMKAGSNVFYANGAATRAATNSPPLAGDFKKIYRSLKANKAKEISEIISASAKISTEPVESAYFVMGSTYLDADIRKMTGFIPSTHYADSSKRLPGEIGKVDQFRFVLTSMFDPWEAGGTDNSGSTYLTNLTAGTGYPDIFPMIVVAQDAYAIVPLQGFESIELTVVNPGTPTKDDMHGQIGFASWLTSQTGGILNQAWLVRYECCATSSPT